MTALPKVQIEADVLEIIEEHCFSETTLEVGGFLVGKAAKGVTSIVHALPALKAVSGQVNLTFGHDAWEDALATVQSDFPDEKIIGWYHSHPGFGLFLSDYDSFIQENFFSDPSHVALVVDPLAGNLGWFVVRDSEVVELFREDTSRDAILPPAAEKVDLDEEQVEKREGGLVRMLVLTLALAAILGLTIGWYVHNNAAVKDQQAKQVAAIAMQQEASVTCQEKLQTYKEKFPKINLDSYCVLMQSGMGFSKEVLLAQMDAYGISQAKGLNEKVLRWFNPNLDKDISTPGKYLIIPQIVLPVPDEPTTTPTVTPPASISPSPSATPSVSPLVSSSPSATTPVLPQFSIQPSTTPKGK